MTVFWIEKTNVFHLETQTNVFFFAKASNAFRGKNQIHFFSLRKEQCRSVSLLVTSSPRGKTLPLVTSSRPQSCTKANFLLADETVGIDLLGVLTPKRVSSFACSIQGAINRKGHEGGDRLGENGRHLQFHKPRIPQL